MKCSIHITEPNILCEARPGDLFVVNAAGEGECVCALLGVERLPPITSFWTGQESLKRVVVVACRIDEGAPGYHVCGDLLLLLPHTPITYVEQIEVAAFRERKASLSDIAASALRAAFGSACEEVSVADRHVHFPGDRI